MSSGITFSGFSNIDFNLVVSAAMTQASQPLNSLKSQQSALKSQVNTFDALSSKLSALDSAASALAGGTALTTYSASVSDSSIVSASTGTGAIAGRYDVVVNELSRVRRSRRPTARLPTPDDERRDGRLAHHQRHRIDVQAPVTLADLAKPKSTRQWCRCPGIGRSDRQQRLSTGAHRHGHPQNRTPSRLRITHRRRRSRRSQTRTTTVSLAIPPPTTRSRRPTRSSPSTTWRSRARATRSTRRFFGTTLTLLRSRRRPR